MTTGDEKRPVFKRRPNAGDDPSIAQRAAQELEDLKSDKQGAGVNRTLDASMKPRPAERRRASAAESRDEPLARVQAMVPRSLRDDFLVATRRGGTNAQHAIADFVRKYVEKHADRR